MKKIIAKYKNGNYNVCLMDDGTKIRMNKLDNLTPAFAESIDCTITTKCNGGCPYCYLGCNENGVHADLNQPFFDTLHAGQELALNGNDLSHPDLITFLLRMKRKGVVCNITVNQKHFIEMYHSLYAMSRLGLIHGVGVSLTDSNDPKLYYVLKDFPNVVVHVIDGLFTCQDILNMGNKGIKLLILGYKRIGRGEDYFDTHEKTIEDNIKFLHDNIKEISECFKVVSFDNLAIEHLGMKDHLSKEEWDKLYMGDEGQYTFYIDAVNHKYAVSSLSTTQYDLLDNVDDMFKHVREVAK